MPQRKQAALQPLNTNARTAELVSTELQQTPLHGIQQHIQFKLKESLQTDSTVKIQQGTSTK